MNSRFAILLASLLAAPLTWSSVAWAAEPTCLDVFSCLQSCSTLACQNGCLAGAAAAATAPAVSLFDCAGEKGCLALTGADASECIADSCGPEWLVCEEQSYVAQPGDPCPAGFAANCSGQILLVCDGGVLATVDCGALGLNCAFDASASAYACLGEEPNACGRVTADGECQGNVLVSCANNELVQVDCGAIGESCDFDETSKAYDCLAGPAAPPVVGDPCPEELTFEGACFGSAVYWCEGGKVDSIDCAAIGETCGWSEAEGLFDCLSGGGGGLVPGGPCPEGLTYDGLCEGNTVYWCENDIVETLDCSAQDLVCGLNASAGFYDCMQASGGGLVPGAPCPSDLSFEGLCDDGSVYWCEDGKVNTINCASNNAVCAFNAEQKYYDCFPEDTNGVPAAGSPCPSDLDFSGKCAGDTVYWCEGGLVKVADCAANGAKCGYDDQAEVYDCLTSSGGGGGGGNNECGDVSTVGMCEGTTVKWCENGKLQSANCSSLSATCGFDPGSGLYDCIGGSEGGGGGSGGGGGVPPGQQQLVSSGGGCSATGGTGAMAWLAGVAVLGWGMRRRRSVG